MKKNLIRKVIALAGAVVLTVSVAACGSKDDSGTATNPPSNNNNQSDTQNGGSEDNGGGDESQPGETVDPNAEVPVDLNGYVFSIIDFHPTRWEPTELGTPIADTTVAIIEEIESLYNCDIVVEGVAPDLIFEKIQPAVFANDKYADLVVATEWAYGRLLGANLMGDLKNVSTMNLENEWWVQPIIDSMTVDGKVLAAAGSFNYHSGPTWQMFFNKAIWAELGYEDAYELVRTGQWTWDKMAEFARGARLDNDGDGVVSSNIDRWGLIAPRGDFARGMFLSMGGRFYSTDANGKVVLACTNAETYSIFDFMRSFVGETGMLMNTDVNPWEEIAAMYMNRKALFLACTADTPALKEMEDDFGILPMPKKNAEQANYIGVVDHNASIFGITSTNRDLDKVGYVLEALGRRYTQIEEMRIEDWEMTLYRSDEDSEMMQNYIRRSGGYDIALIVQNANPVLGSPMSAMFDSIFSSGSGDLVSTLESIKDPIEYQIGEFFGYVTE